jgi:hypothetical protein
MSTLSRIVDVELIGPTSIGFRLGDERKSMSTDRIVISPADFIEDFSVFLTAIRAAGMTRPVDTGHLCTAWQQARETLRRSLIEDDPWGEPPASPPGAEAVVALGEERLKAQRARRNSAP